MGQVIFRIIVVIVMLCIIYLLVAVVATAAGWSDPLGLIGRNEDDNNE